MATQTHSALTSAELSALFAQLRLVYRAGLTVVEGLDILSANLPAGREQALLQELQKPVAEGAYLSEALRQTGRLPEYALSLLRIGEETGRMEETLQALQAYYEKRDELQSAVRSSLIYPLSMIGMVIVVVIVLLTQAMPIFQQVFAQLGLPMTGLALGLLDLGQGLSRSALAIGGVVAALLLCYLLLRLTRRGRAALSTLFDRFPLTRGLSLRLSAQRFAQAMGTLLSCGLQPDDALALTLPLLSSGRARAHVAALQAAMAQGTPFEEALLACGLLPGESQALVVMGFRSGAAGETLAQVGDHLTRRTEEQLAHLVAALEPTLVAILCVIVGLMLFSVMLPLIGILANL